MVMPGGPVVVGAVFTALKKTRDTSQNRNTTLHIV
jgi:hypothetical protein